MHKIARTSALDCAYLEWGAGDGVPVILVHGFPDDARTWTVVGQALAAAGFRVIAPFVRGFGPTRLLPGAGRTGEFAALARDILELAGALGLERFHLIGHDWGARAAYSVAVLAPERLRTLTALAVAYGTNIAQQTLSIEQIRAYWYQWYFATPRGEAALRDTRYEFCRQLWGIASSEWRFSEAEYAATAASFDNPDFVAIALHSYRVRWDFAPRDPAYAADTAVLARVPPIAVPTQVIMGANDGATLPQSADAKEHLFPAGYGLTVVPRCGHFLQRERPDDVLAVVVPALRAARA